MVDFSGAPNSAKFGEGVCRFDKKGGGGVAIIFLGDKNIHFLAFLRKAIKKDLYLGSSFNKNVHFLEFLRKAIKKRIHI